MQSDTTSATTMSDLGKPIAQGAEARLYATHFQTLPCIVKERFRKRYRHPSLDEQLRQKRLRAETRSILRCLELGLRVPNLYHVDTQSCSIWMERIDGPTVRQFIAERLSGVDGDNRASLERLADTIGFAIGQMHRAGVIHGDLTTSNMIVVVGDQVAFIDFGLSSIESSAEQQAVDLYVLERAIKSAHPNCDWLFSAMLGAYGKGLGGDVAACATLRRFEAVRQRGRKRQMIG